MDKIEELLDKAKKYKMSPEEEIQQKISFVWGQMMDCNPKVTREEIELLIRKNIDTHRRSLML